MAEVRVSRERFREMAEAELAAVPPRLRALLTNLVIEVKDEPGPEAEDMEEGEELLGLYTGPTREELVSGAAHGQLPPKVYLYQWSIEDSVESVAELRKEIRLTLRHELAHHFGFSDEDIEDVWPEGA